MPIRLRDDELIDIPISPLVRHIVPGVQEDLELKQEESNWCWAACAEMIIKLIKKDKNISQCLLAQKFANPAKIDCCKNKGGCNNPVEKSVIKDIYKHHRIKTDFVDIKPSDVQDITNLIVKQIDRPNPSVIQALYSSGEDSQHVTIIYGWFKNADDEMILLIKDPWGSADDGSYKLKEILLKGWIGAWVNIRK